MGFRILITGSRHHTNYNLIKDTLERVVKFYGAPEVTVVHGAAPGADTLAAKAAFELGYNVESYPADWSIGKAAGPLRNQKMVNTGANVCIAFPEEGSRGTYDCTRRASNAGIPLIVVK